MVSALDVAKFFVTMTEPQEGDFVTNLKLQKLLYYAQGFALVVLDRPLFQERIEAWEHGPVVPVVYHGYKAHGAGGIPMPDSVDASVFKKAELDLLSEVWNVFGQFSAWKLRNMTHEEPPWVDTPRGETISHEVLVEYFRTQVK